MIRFGWLADDAPALYPSAGDRYPPPRNSRRGTTIVGNDGAGAQVRRGDDPRALNTRLRALADIGAPPSYKRAPSGRASKG